MANQVEIRIQVDDGGSSTATASRFDAALASMTEQQRIATAEMIKNTHELGMQTQVETELMKAKYLDMFEKVRASGMLTASELQAVNTKIAGIKVAGNMNELNDAMRITIPTTEKLIATQVTAAEVAAVLKTSWQHLTTAQYGVNEATARVERQLIATAARMAIMAVSIGAVVTAYKDANLINEDMQKSTEDLHNAFFGLREELANGLAPTFVLLNEGMAVTMDGMSGYIARLQIWSTEAGSTFAKIAVITKGILSGRKYEDDKSILEDINRAAEEQISKALNDFTERGKKLQAAMDAKKGGVGGGGGAPEAVDYGIEREAIAIQKEYQAMLDATMSAEDRKAAQLEQFHQRAIEIYGAEEAAAMKAAITKAQARQIELQAVERFSTSIYNNYVRELAITKNIGDAIVAATKSAVAEKIKAIGQEEAILAGKELWDGFGALARYDFPSAGNHFLSAAGHAANAALAGAASVAVGGGGGAGGAAPSSVAQGGIESSANVQQERETSYTVVVDATGAHMFTAAGIDMIFKEINTAIKTKGQRFEGVKMVY